MRDADIDELPLYPEDRACKAPTAARSSRSSSPFCAHQLAANGEVLKRYDPNLSRLHHQLLDLLQVPLTAYRADRTTQL